MNRIKIIVFVALYSSPIAVLAQQPQQQGKASCSQPPAPAPAARAQDIPKTTYTYKKVGDLDIQADVYRSSDDQVRPVVVNIHGGALMGGGRQQVGNWPGKLVARGYAVVSIDYRLAPETKLPELIGDVEDAFRWVRERGPALFHVDPDRLAVIGGSAGGYLPLKNVTSEYPPTLLIHGTADTDVPYEQSVLMEAELAKHHVEHKLISIPGGEHGFGGGDPRLIGEANQAALRFIEQHVPR